MARWVTVRVIAGASTLLVVGCGNSTFTLTDRDTGVPITIVVTSDSTAIAALEHNLPALSGVSVQNGDEHVGSRYCRFNVSKDGHTYQVDYYFELSGPVPGSLDGVCGTANRQEFLSKAP